MTMPKVIANTKPRITSPPSTSSAMRASSVVPEVITVRLMVSLIDRFSTSLRSITL